MAQSETLTVSDAMFIGGMDSFSLPNYLGQGEIVASMNTVCRGGIVQTRPGTRSLYSIPGLNIQGFTGFTPASGVPHHVIAIDGLIYVSPAPFSTFRRLDSLRFSVSSKFICFENCLKSTDYDAEGTLYFVDKPYNVLMIQDGATRAAFWDGSVARHLNPTPSDAFDTNGERITQPGFDETYIGLWMKWSGNRLWVSRNGMLFASDIGNPLKFTEAQYLNEGRAFYLTGECTGMIETPEQDGLIVFTIDNGTLFQTSIQERETWLSTPNFQKIVFSNIGCAAPLSLIKQYGLIWWFSPMGLINSDQAFALNRSSRIDIQDNEMMCSKGNMGPDISGVCTVSYENYLLCSVPSGDNYNRHTWCLDQAVFEGPLNAWNSYWTGWRPVQWASLSVSGEQRVFFASRDYNDCLRVWEANLTDRTDNEGPITCFAQFRQNAFGRPDQLKRFAWAELNLQEVLGDVSLMVAVGGRKGAFTRILTKELAATPGGIYGDSIYDVNSCMYGHRPQTRVVRTQENVTPGLCNKGGIESPQPNDVDLSFGLLAVWSGRMGIASYLAQAVIFEDQAAGNCEPDEANPNSVSEQGCSDRNYYVNTCAFPLFTGSASAEYTCPVNASVISEVGTSTSVISQVDADRKAFYTAYNNARQWCEECVFPAWRNTRQRFTAFCLTVEGSNTVVVPAGTYRSYVSQADANLQAYNAARTQAENELVCTYWNTEQEYTATCPPGFAGEPVTATVPAGTYSSTVSQAAADEIALDAAREQAEAALVCAPIIPPDEIPGLTGWWESDLQTGYNDGDPVTILLDSSGLARHMLGSSSNLTRRPIFRTNIQNGLPGIEIGPAVTGFGGGKFFDQPAAPAQTQTLFYCVRLNGAAFNLEGGNLAGTTFLETGYPNEPWLPGSPSSTQFVSYGNYQIFVNDNPVPTLQAVFGDVVLYCVERSTVGGDALLTGNGLGAAPDAMYFGHLTYSRLLTPTEKANVLTYFRTKLAF